MSPASYEDRMAWAEACALLRVDCPWCERRLRPCNLGRHIASRHFRQLTIYDVMAEPGNDSGALAR